MADFNVLKKLNIKSIGRTAPFARARDTRGCVDEKSFEKLKIGIDKWVRMLYNVYCEVRTMTLEEVLEKLLCGWEDTNACEIFKQIPNRMGKCDGDCVNCIKIMLDKSKKV